jgi:hypothetical protein
MIQFEVLEVYRVTIPSIAFGAAGSTSRSNFS